MAGYQVKTIDLLNIHGLKINGAGPLLVREDPARNRVILVNTYTSSISIIDGEDHSVHNIPVKTRVPQYLKDEALRIDPRTGHIYVVGSHCLHVIFPESGTAQTVTTEKQYETVAVDEKTGRAFLVGRESRHILIVDPAAGTTSIIDWVDHEEPMINLNQTPPPPIRKVFFDADLNRLYAIDGFTSMLFVFDAQELTLLKTTRLNLSEGGRWHLAGYDGRRRHLYLVVETDERKVVEAADLDLAHERHIIVTLPGLTEGVGMALNTQLDEVYIAYDNEPTLHVVDFSKGGIVSEVKLPAYGNDAVALDVGTNRLYVASWAFGEVDVVDLQTRSLVKRIQNLGIIPHMFSMSFNPENGLLYIPIGATAVNGSFGAAVTTLDPCSGKTMKIRTGWAPMDLIQNRDRDSFLVFSSEDEYVEVSPAGIIRSGVLPCMYPTQAANALSGQIYLSYGPHQSYWPVVYIRGAKNGILRIDPVDMTFYDRRIPRLAHEIVVDKNGTLVALQNNWGKEKQFLTVLEDEIRVFDPRKRIELSDEIVRETTLRTLRYDESNHRLYVLRTGDAFIFVANFDAGNITVVDRSNFSSRLINAGKGPLKLDLSPDGARLYVINHLENTLHSIAVQNGFKSKSFSIPRHGYPDNIFVHNNRVIITSHSPDRLDINAFNPKAGTFNLIHEMAYPFGGTRFDTANTAFYMRGQFGDALFSLTKIKTDNQGKIWITDFLSGKVFIIEEKSGL